jgi:protocatechuate 3,4-dioxygenase, beta subunit
MLIQWLMAILLMLTGPVFGSGNSSLAVLSPANEPGTRLVVRGQLFDPSGTKPAAGVSVYAYHTDTEGHYNKRGTNEPRLRGWVTTDAQGKFELRTIRPGSYPGRRDPAHIHFNAWGGGYPKQWLDELQFDDDPKVTAELKERSRAKGKFAPIVTTTRDAKGVLHATIHLRLSERSNF